MITEYILIKTNNVAHIVRRNIVPQNVFIKKMQQNEDTISAKNFTKHSIINVLKNKRKKEELKA